MFLKYRIQILVLFFLLSIGSAYYVTTLKFSFSFDQFFPKDDDDFLFYKEFTQEFETDDNFLLIAIPNSPDVFDSIFLNKFHDLSLKLRDAPFILNSQSLTQIKYPIKTPFGYTSVSAIHLDEPDKYKEDKTRILNDKRLVYNLINDDATALAIALKVEENIGMEDSKKLMIHIDSILKVSSFTDYHVLGRAHFQNEIVAFQKQEILFSFFISIILVSLIMIWLFRKPVGITIALGSIALGLLLFMGLLGLLGRELNALSALYPVLMLIVGSSDVIHIFTKYIDELKLGKDKHVAMRITIKEIGLATFMTSATTAIGFATLLTSKLETIREFGLNSAIGVMVAYITVLFFTTSLLILFDKDKILRQHANKDHWKGFLNKVYELTTRYPKRIVVASLVSFFVFLLGISLIKTNYGVEDNLPRGSRVATDFLYFEKNFGGFRPMEFAIFSKIDSLLADSYEVVREVDKLEQEIQRSGYIKTSVSQATLYRSFSQVNRGNSDSAYIFPATEEEFYQYKRFIDRVSSEESAVLLSKDKMKTRISSRIVDIGADSIKLYGDHIDKWIASNLDTSLVAVRRTGTGLILDKNSEYVKQNLLQGLGFSLSIISVLMGLLFRSFKMMLLALIPNIFPLLMAGSILGFFGIDLEAGVSIVFALIFGIAVDDTIHFLARFKLCLINGKSSEEAIKISIHETGKAIIITSILLFFGFFNMIFSSNPPTQTIGLLISTTLLGAVIFDLFLLPVILRKFL